ncbi:hypothetical protein SAMN04488026_104339 [Aliiruegeria lutimaris]|uniref:DUF1127 domain-containing protein n=1 Tax=Aliiruegeria lutimaris TaxID=571298 RepID=A0A1G9CHU9_9RHOB|nr:hypothetical protein SAMN04488026_104339 [Aliiruegeria lutimaris]
MTYLPGACPDRDAARLRAVRYFADICSGRAPMSEKQGLIDKVRELEAKSDEELSSLGILREDIVDHVFRDAHFV